MYKYGLGHLQLAAHVIKQVSGKAGHGQDTDWDTNLDMDTDLDLVAMVHCQL